MRLAAEPVPVEVMIALDRSGSMQESGRWEPSISALQRITAALQAKIRFGLTLFPDPDASRGNVSVEQVLACDEAVDPDQCVIDLDEAAALARECAAGSVKVPVGPGIAAEIEAVLRAEMPQGGTPTSATLEALGKDFATSTNASDAESPAKVVLLVTDGAPTCPAGKGAQTTQADLDASDAAIEKLTALGVRTYVIGYDTTGPGNEQLAETLDGFARRGGTGDMQHRPVEDEASLLATLEGITGEIASCSFTLDRVPERADFVLVRLDDEQLNLGDPNGWRQTSELTLELVGRACEQFRTGTHTLSAEVHCSVVGPS